MREVSNIRKLEILIIQLFPIYLLSFVLASHELLVFLMVVHTISYYISAYSKNFKYRTLAEECIQTLKYILVYIFLSCIVFPILEPNIPYLSLANLLCIVTVNSIMLMIVNIWIRKIWKYLSLQKKIYSAYLASDHTCTS